MTNLWSREETVVAFNVYCQIPFRKSNKTHLLVVEYARLLGRSPSALNMKIGNFGRLDPELKERGISGLLHGAKTEESVWAEFSDDPGALLEESERIVKTLQKKTEVRDQSDNFNPISGEERRLFVKCRYGQDFFREVVLSAYASKCCISQISERRLLEACHIVSWAEDAQNRLNPKNGLCLNLFFHGAYDAHLLGISPDYRVEVSERLLASAGSDSFRTYLRGLQGKEIVLPEHFSPSQDLLARQYDKFLQTQ